MSETAIPLEVSAALSPVGSSIDPVAARCGAETRIWSAIQATADFRDRLHAATEGSDQATIRTNLSLLTGAYRVDRVMSPRLDRLREQLRSSLNLVQPIDIYVVADPVPNAFCVPSRKGTRLVMGLHSALFSLMTPTELLFVLGHEAAHALLGHTEIPKIGFDHPQFSMLEVVRLRSLSRSHEISCDRIGLMACRDVRSAVSALFKLMSGLSAEWLRFDESAFASHFDEISSVGELTDLNIAAATHPLIALRVKALLAFSQSQLYGQWSGQPTEGTSTEHVEKSVEHMLSVVEPDLSALENASEEKAANQFLVNGALAIVASDGIIEPSEASFLKSKGISLTAELRDKMSTAGFAKMALEGIRDEAHVLSRKLSVASRAGLLHQLCVVAGAGGVVSRDLEVVAAIADMLEVPREILQRVMASAESAVPEDSEPKKKRAKRRKKGTEPDVEASSSSTPDSESSAKAGR